MDSLIVYTANFGNRDIVRKESFHKIFPKIRYLYFCDKSPEPSSDLNDREVIIEKPRFKESPNKSAKWYKMHSHVLFPKQTTLWLDSNYGISKLDSPINMLSIFEHILLWQHYRGCAYKEAIACESVSDDPVKLKLQMQHYRAKGLPENFGLWKGGLIFRKPTKIVKLFNELWWNEICQWQIRDQVSLPYVIWKYQIPYNDIHFEKKFGVGRRGIHTVIN